MIFPGLEMDFNSYSVIAAEPGAVPNIIPEGDPLHTVTAPGTRIGSGLTLN